MPLKTALRDTNLITSLLTTAETESRALGDPRPEAEHLVLAALLVEDPSAREALDVDAATFRAALRSVHRLALDAIGINVADDASALPAARGVYRSATSAQEVFARARILARRSATGLRAAHVLIAAAEREHGTVSRILAHLHRDRAAVIASATAAADRPRP